MVKIAVSELEQLLTLIKKTSTDTHIIVREDMGAIHAQFHTVDNQISNVSIYDEDTRIFAKVTASESLIQTLARLKK